MTARTTRVVAALLAGAAALFAPAAPATAAGATTARLTVDTGTLVLTPTDEGYVGALTTTISNRGRADATAGLRITEPAGGSFTGLDNGSPWFTVGMEQNRRVVESYGGRVPAGASVTLRLHAGDSALRQRRPVVPARRAGEPARRGRGVGHRPAGSAELPGLVRRARRPVHAGRGASRWRTSTRRTTPRRPASAPPTEPSDTCGPPGLRAGRTLLRLR